MGNGFAFASLFIFPVAAVLMYQRWDPLKATFWTMAGGYMFLPTKVGIDLPVIPAFTKETIPCFVAMACLITVGRRKLQLLPDGWLVKILFVTSVIAPIMTAVNNSEPIVTEERFSPALSLYDALSSVQNAYLELLPFLVGFLVIRSNDDLLRVTKYLVIAILIYSPLMMMEVRLSPQLHRWIYGFFPHSFAQMMREGGFRPVVFFGHGLLVAIFTTCCALAATVLYRLKIRTFNAPPQAIVLFTLFLLVICKSMGALMLGFMGVAMLAVLKLRMINLVTTTLLVLVISYPILSFMDMFPHDWLVEQAAKQSEERADSLGFRFGNEEALLGRAMEKPLFGWGGYGRARLDDSTTDGYWIITVGNRGLVGFFSLFGTAAIACFSALGASSDKKASEQRRLLMAGMALTGTLILVDNLPNASMVAFAWFLFGIMYGASRVPAADEIGSDPNEPPAKDEPEAPAGPRDLAGPRKSLRDHYLGRT